MNDSAGISLAIKLYRADILSRWAEESIFGKISLFLEIVHESGISNSWRDMNREERYVPNFWNVTWICSFNLRLNSLEFHRHMTTLVSIENVPNFTWKFDCYDAGSSYWETMPCMNPLETCFNSCRSEMFHFHPVWCSSVFSIPEYMYILQTKMRN